MNDPKNEATNLKNYDIKQLKKKQVDYLQMMLFIIEFNLSEIKIALHYQIRLQSVNEIPISMKGVGVIDLVD